MQASLGFVWPGMWVIESFTGRIRVYYVKKGSEWIILLAGGDKSTQATDIDAALQLARDLEE